MGSRRHRTDLDALQERLGHTFDDSEILLDALTHRSYAHEHRSQGVRDNERLEFLGDAVLDLVVAELLMDKYPTADEGALSRARAALVSERSLSRVARSLELGEWLRLGRGEERSGGRDKSSLLADSFEALVASLYIDGDLEEVSKIVDRLFQHRMEYIMEGELNRDAKSRLQEYLQANHATLPAYVTVGESGPEHDKRFHVEVSVWGYCVGRGEGRSKKEAEQCAAGELLAALKGGRLDLNSMKEDS